MNIQDNKEIIFSAETIKKLPLGYRFLTKMSTDHVPELRIGAKYSQSKRHGADAYLTFDIEKPISNIYLDIPIINDTQQF
ncbi:hypothetical protein [Pedobacter sp. R20-19]|uniref:hypothetical protein n=1 Tax=Pedobacter sp. R20-19 TaxID=1270196 RepID=UPI00049399AA|nr:hypothetical protein [Pedobacter sp. R20-19]